jgi:hypothetical protein
MDPVMHIAATNARVVYREQDIVWRFELWNRALLEGYIVCFVEDER